MGLMDILLAIGILVGVVYILYRFNLKKKSLCHGCMGSCSMDKTKNKR